MTTKRLTEIEVIDACLLGAVVYSRARMFPGNNGMRFMLAWLVFKEGLPPSWRDEAESSLHDLMILVGHECP